MKIGNHELASPWILAPMAGVSQLPFRRLARAKGAAATPTELISAKGLMYRQPASERYLCHDPDETPFWVQLFGGEPEPMAIAAARAVALGAEIIDVNMGCPVRKVTKTGAGAALARDAARAAQVVAAMVARVSVPITVKIRSGWDADEVAPWELVARLADAGAAAVAIHGRTSVQGYAGKADWRVIAELVERSPIPVIGNGDAFTAERARALRAETACAAVMIGRGAMGNPWIFEQLTTTRAAPSADQRWRLIERHLGEHVAFFAAGKKDGERRGLRAFRPHLVWYSHAMPNASAFRRQVMQIDEFEELRAVCAAFFTSGLPAASASPEALTGGPALG